MNPVETVKFVHMFLNVCMYACFMVLSFFFGLEKVISLLIHAVLAVFLLQAE